MPEPTQPRRDRHPIWAGALLAAAAALAYLPSLRNGFIWDDDAVLTANATLKASGSLDQFWFTHGTQDYWPVTETSLWAEWRLWGMHAMGYHATNLALHVVECLLLWALLRRLRIRGAWLGALLFAVHPVNVESVAWITQRKNLMAMLFFLPAILFFLRAEPETPAPPGKLWKPGAARWILLSLIAFTLAMLSKGSVVILPVVLLGIILWHRRPTWSDGVVLAPFCAVAAVLAAVNVWFQTHGGGEIIRHASKLDRLLGAAAALLFYLSKAIWPHPLIFIYPQWTVSAGDPLWWLPLVGVAAATWLLWRGRRAAKPMLFAWAYFALALAPALGFVDVTFMKYSLVADHYQHLALIGLTTLAGFGWKSLFDRLQGTPRAAWIGLATIVAVALAALTAHQCLIYRNVFTLYKDTLAKNPACWLAENNLGDAEARCGHPQEAMARYERALQIHPDFPEARCNLGLALENTGHLSEAMAQYREAIRVDPTYAPAHYDLGNAWWSLERPDQAAAEYEQALRLKPIYPDAENNLGSLLAGAGQFAAAMPHFERALAADPDDAEARKNLALAHYNLGIALNRLGRSEEAMIEFQKAKALAPGAASGSP